MHRVEAAQCSGRNRYRFQRITAILVPQREPKKAICLALTNRRDSWWVDKEDLLIPHRVFVPLNNH